MRKLLLSLAILLGSFWAIAAVAVPVISYQMAHRTADIVIAASNASYYAKASADIVVAGVQDDLAINAAIATLSNGGRVRFTEGQFYLRAPIVVDWDWVTLEGNALPHWNNWNGAYPIVETPGAPGGSQFIQTVSGQDGFHVGATSANMHGDTRHKGIRLTQLYFYGTNFTGTAIYDTAHTAISQVDHCAIQGFGAGINVQWDTPTIANNSIQGVGGAGITVAWVYGFVTNNIVFDNLGPGIVAAAPGAQIVGNIVGDLTGGDAIQVQAQGVAVTGNKITAIPGGNGINVNASGAYASITGNVINLTGTAALKAPNTTNNTAYNGILTASGATYVSITGNVIDNASSANSTGYALNLAGANNNATGNTISGAKWNAASTTFNVTSTGAGNLLWHNVGQLAIYSAAGVAVPACGATYTNVWLLVSDATTPTYNGTYTSGGAVSVPVLCNGTNWTTH
jgi:putative cofactor-binding repeat protein